jgi:DNA-binding NarL/FixJ family response regulator
LFTDIVMPGRLNGIALAGELRALCPDARILFTSGFSSPTMLREQVYALGGAELIGKPYRKAELAMLVRSVLNRTAETAA